MDYPYSFIATEKRVLFTVHTESEDIQFSKSVHKLKDGYEVAVRDELVAYFDEIFAAGDQIPYPKKGKYPCVCTIPVTLSANIYLCNAFNKSGISRKQLSQELQIDASTVTRQLQLHIDKKVDTLEKTLRYFGYKLDTVLKPIKEERL